MCISDPPDLDIRSPVIVKPDYLKELVTGYIASPKGQKAIRNYLSSPEGKKTLDTYLSTPEGQEMACLVLVRAREGTNLSPDVKAKVLAAVEKKGPRFINRSGK